MIQVGMLVQSLNIREHNLPAHAHIELDIISKKSGHITFTLRVNAGNIVDYNLVEYVDIDNKYGFQ